LMRLSELKSAGRTPALPLILSLADAAGPADLQLLSLLRVLPGQRYVGAGVWRGRPVLAKLLVGSKAARHFQRELDGVRLLAAQGLTTPLLLADGLKGGEGGWLLFEYLEGAESLGDAWQHVESLPVLADEQSAVLAEALGAIGQMHRKGLWQEDLHSGQPAAPGPSAVFDRRRRNPQRNAGPAVVAAQSPGKPRGVFRPAAAITATVHRRVVGVLPAEQWRTCLAHGSAAEADRQGPQLAPQGFSQ
jgi:hypothetical protein